MQKVVLGRTGLEVTRLGFGALEMRDVVENGGRLPSEEHAGVVLNAVLDSGINFIDTAPGYGRSEEFIGRFISDRRGEYYLATKCGRPQTGVAHAQSEWSRADILRSIDESLGRLKTDYVDLLQLHGPKVEDVEAHGCVETLKEVQASGKARFIGVSAILPDIATFVEWGVFDAFQIVYSALEPEHEETIASAEAAGAGTIIRGGSVKGAPLREQGRGGEFPTVRRRWVESGLSETLEGMDLVSTMFRYALGHPSAHTFINGTQNLEHLAANIAAAEAGPLDADLHAAIHDRVAAVVAREAQSERG